MNKLSAEKCREFIDIFKSLEKEGHLSLASEYHLQAYEKALPILEQQESTTDTYRQIVNDGWIEWQPGMMPNSVRGLHVQVRYASGDTDTDTSNSFNWGYGLGDLVIAYRVIENDGREG